MTESWITMFPRALETARQSTLGRREGMVLGVGTRRVASRDEHYSALDLAKTRPSPWIPAKNPPMGWVGS